jgi:hypothetical protein
MRLLVIIIVMLSAFNTYGQTGDEKAIRAVIDSVWLAMQRSDSTLLRRSFTDDATFVTIYRSKAKGQVLEREALAPSFRLQESRMKTYSMKKPGTTKYRSTPTWLQSGVIMPFTLATRLVIVESMHFIFTSLKTGGESSTSPIPGTRLRRTTSGNAV